MCRNQQCLILYPYLFSFSIVGYVPEGMSPEQYRKLCQKEAEETKKKNFAAYGPQSFKSRSLQSFQKDLESGKANHLMPVFNAKEKLKSGAIKKEDIPYMQRLGSWDNSDIGKTKKWSDDDKKYIDKANQENKSLDWAGKKQRTGPQQAQKQVSEKSNKKMFGLF